MAHPILGFKLNVLTERALSGTITVLIEWITNVFLMSPEVEKEWKETNI